MRCCLLILSLLAPGAAHAKCTWTVKGTLVGSDGAPLAKHKVKVAARWKGHPYNTVNWPETRTDGKGRFTIKSRPLIECKRKRDFKVSAPRFGGYRTVKTVTGMSGPKPQLGRLRVDFVGGALDPDPKLKKTCKAAKAKAKACPGGLDNCKGKLSFGKSKVPYYRNRPLNKTAKGVKRAVIMIHGHGRNVRGYFESALRGVQRACKLDETLVVAPHFQAVYAEKSTLPKPDKPAKDEIYWEGVSGWKRAGQSTARRSPQLSSFEVVDHLVKALSDKRKFPNLKEVVIAGHSAGGQYVQRYAMLSAEPDRHQRRLKFSYIVTNPGSYAYVRRERQVRGTTDKWAVPTGCAGYDKWHYGLKQLPAYARGKRADVQSRYARRKVTYFIGTRDTKTSGRALDSGCKARLQGASRYDRAVTMKRFMEAHFPRHHHRLIEATAGHSHRDMFGFDAGAALLTGHGL